MSVQEINLLVLTFVWYEPILDHTLLDSGLENVLIGSGDLNIADSDVERRLYSHQPVFAGVLSQSVLDHNRTDLGQLAL